MKVLIAMLSLVVLLSAYPALAEWPGGPGFRGPGSEGGRLLERLIDPTKAACRASCFDTAHTCRDDAETAMLTSVQSQSSCSGEIQMAQSKCKADHTSQDCQTARSALFSCAQPAMKTLQLAFRDCRNHAETCVDACNSTQ